MLQRCFEIFPPNRAGTDQRDHPETCRRACRICRGSGAGAGPEDPSEHGGHLLELCASDDRKDLLSLDKDAAGYTNARTITGTRSVTQIAIMEQLANNLQGELMEMAGTAKRSVENVFTIARLENDPYRKLALEQILRQEAAGKPWIKSSQDLVKELETNGITGFTDKAGRKWSMQTYGNMAVRTTARQAEVAALLTSDEYDLWQITKVGTTCPVCAPLEGRVY